MKKKQPLNNLQRIFYYFCSDLMYNNILNLKAIHSYEGRGNFLAFNNLLNTKTIDFENQYSLKISI